MKARASKRAAAVTVRLTLAQVDALVDVGNEGLMDLGARLGDEDQTAAGGRKYATAERALEALKKARDNAEGGAP